MTGHGDAQAESSGLRVSVDVRAVNSRFFKINVRGGDIGGDLESKIEALVKKRVRRGTVTLQLQVKSESASNYRINQDVLRSYFKQLSRIDTNLNLTASGNVTLDTMLTLPGVVESDNSTDSSDETWKLIETVTGEALDNFQKMRQVEGQAMAEDLEKNLSVIAGELEKIEARSPEVVAAYETRLTERINGLLEKHDVAVSAGDVIREVGVFSERADISEECVRLRSHLDQFHSIMENSDVAGKKLDFVVQEMFRETNTIGSKANDAVIAKHVIEMKSCVERIREMIQNIE